MHTLLFCKKLSVGRYISPSQNSRFSAITSGGNADKVAHWQKVKKVKVKFSYNSGYCLCNTQYTVCSC